MPVTDARKPIGCDVTHCSIASVNDRGGASFVQHTGTGAEIGSMDHLDGEYLLEHPMIEYNEALRTLWQVRSDSHARKSCCSCMRVPYTKKLHD